MSILATQVRNFVYMSVHVGGLLKEVKEKSRVTVEELLKYLPYETPAAVFRHWRCEDLSTNVIRSYVKAFDEMGIRVDVFELIAKRERGETAPVEGQGIIGIRSYKTEAAPPLVLNEPKVTEEEDADDEVAALLRKAADLLEKRKKS